ncbi:protein Cep78 homolog [Armigeres subalbatus]|uniref:protein Cep78 homolog n=1 Tax=Armigeres subalbatus TaxID=124917 RepID=UPI002ECFDD57
MNSDCITSSCNRRRSRNFYRRYLTLCRAKNVAPLADLAGNAGGGGSGVHKSKVNHSCRTVDFFGDRFREVDWQLIIDALGEDSSLEVLGIRLRKVFGEIVENGYHRIDGVADRPVILTKRLFTRLVDSLQNFLKNNQSVSVLILEAIPVQGIHMAAFVDGLQHSWSLTQLSLSRSAIGDEGCEAICSVVMHLHKLESLNMSACQLTTRGCRAVAELVKYQKIKRFAQSWEHSLRYGDVDVEEMQGLRIVSLSSNTGIGDEGLKELTEVLKDDEWIRQVLFRNCGLTDSGAKLLVDCLNFNKTIKKFDIRSNSGISNEALHEIRIKLGEEVESSDSSQSVPETQVPGPIKLKASEQLICLQHQLSVERNKVAQMQLLIEQLQNQLHLQQEQFALQMNNAMQERNATINQRDKLLNKVQRLEKVRPKSKRTKLRKSKSAALPSDLFRNNSAENPALANGRSFHGTKSEMAFHSHRERRLELSSGGTAKRPHVMERAIGDSGLNSQSNQNELAKMFCLTQNEREEEGFGDIGCSKVTVRRAKPDRQHGNRTQLNDIAEYSGDEYFAHVDEAADQQRLGNGSMSKNLGAHNEDEVYDDGSFGNSLSGADLLKVIARQRSKERMHDTQSLFMSIFSGDEN